MATDYKEMARAEEEALRLHLAGQQGRMQQLREAQVWESDTPPGITTPDGQYLRGYIDEEGDPTESGELFVELLASGLFNNRGELTEKGRAFALDPYDALLPKNLEAYKIRDDNGLNSSSDTGFGDAVDGVLGFASNAIKGTGLVLRQASPLYQLFSSEEQEAEDVLARQGFAEGALEGGAQLGSGIGKWGHRVAAAWSEDEDRFYAAKQRHEKFMADLEDANAAELYGGLMDSAQAVESLNASRDSARKQLGPERADVIEAQGEAGGQLFGDPSNVATLGTGAAVGAAGKLPTMARITAKVEQATMAALRAEELAMQLAKMRVVADKTGRAAKVAADGAERALVANKGLRGRAFNDKATRLGATAEQARAAIPALEQQAADAAAHAQKLAELSGGAQKMVATFQQAQQIGRQIRSAPARVLGPMIEGIGEQVMKADKWVGAHMKVLSEAKKFALPAGFISGNPLAALPAALSAGPLIRSVGSFTKVLGKELMEARGTVPFWQRVAQNTTLTPLQRATAHAFDFATLGGKVPSAIKRTGAGIAAAAPVDMAFEVAASGGDVSPTTLKQGLAESLVFGGGGAFGGAMVKGRVNDLHARAAGDEINFRRGLSPEETRQFSLMDKGARKVMSIYSATFPGLKFKLTDSGPSMFDRGSNTAVINTKAKDFLRPVIAHEVNHYIQVTGQMEDGIRAMLVGEQGGILRGKDGKLDPNFQRFMDSYNQRAKASGIAPLDVNEAALEYFNEATVDSLLADTRRLQSRAGRSAGERMMHKLVEATVMQMPVIKDLFFRTGGAMDGKGMVQGNGLLAGGVRELPEARAMMRKVYDEIAGRRVNKNLSPAMPETTALKPGDPSNDTMFSIFETDPEGNVIKDKDGSPTIISPATDKARAEAGKEAAKAIDAQTEAEAKALEGQPVSDPDPLDLSDPVIREEVESETPEQKATRVKRTSKGDYEGTHLSPKAVQALRKKGALNKMQIAVLRMLNRASRDMDGSTFGAIYHPALKRDQMGKNIRYAPIEASLRDFVPVGIKITKKGNVVVSLLELNQLTKNISERAASDTGKRLYGGNELAIREDVEAVLNLHRQNLKTDGYFEAKYGAQWRKYKNFVNSVLATQTNVQKEHNPIFDEEGISPRSVFKTFRIDRISKTLKIRDGKPLPLGPQNYENAKVNYLPEPVPESAGNRGMDMAESGRANRPAGAPEIQDGGTAQGAVSPGELVAALSPNRKPPLYGQVFQSSAEISRQKAELKNWAAGNGLTLTPDQASALTRGKQRGGGEEHDVFRDGESVIKATRGDSWAAGASPAQYFQRWEDIGKLWPALKPEVIGIEGDRIWTRQTFIDGDVYSNPADLTRDMDAAGWDRLGPRRFKHRASGAVISDVKPSNVIRGKDGRMWPFDVIVDDIGTN
jgi:hypothetical protein